MRKPVILFLHILFLLNAFALQAQNYNAVEWPQATIVLAGGDTVAGPVVFYRAEEVLHLNTGNETATTLTPVLDSSFRVEEEGRLRQFRTYLWNRGKDYSDYRSPAFFEQLNTGNYSLLKREILRQDIVRNDPFWNPYGNFGGPPYGSHSFMTSVQELFYIHTPKGNIISLRKPKQDVLRIFASHQKQIRKYVDDNDLKYNRKNDLIRIVKYYNSLTDPTEPKIDEPVKP